MLDRIANLGEGRKRKDLESIARLVNTFEPEVEDLSDDELRAQAPAFRQRLDAGESIDDLLPEAFAVVREGARRTIGQRHFDVQVMGGAALHQGNIAEMKTGEGKTLVSTLPGYLNALSGEGVHIVTVNDYLAKRDSEWMGGVYRFLGIEVGLIQGAMSPTERRPAYAADITYGTNNEFGFDYLRDNMAMRLAECVQRGHHFAIVDEVDSILIDEARTPLIISGMVQDSAKWYVTFARVAPRLTRDEDYEVDEAKYQVAITEQGVSKVEEILGIENLYEHVNTTLVHHLQNALRAKELYKRDVAYVVTDGEVKIVDEFTGRVLEGRRYSEGLHQSIEAKEGVRIKEENQTLATITIQNYFKMYDKLSGMTGTARTQMTEFEETYKISVVEIPTNRPNVRADRQDLIYKSEEAKWNAVADDIIERSEKGQPVLVGTVSIEKSEVLSGVLNRRGVRHNVLNAKNHEKEADDRRPGRTQGRGDGRHQHGGPRRRHPAGRQPRVPGEGQEMAGREWDNDAYLLFEMGEDDRTAYEVEYEPIYAKLREADRHRARGGRRAGRPLRARDRAARVPSHRQPVARPLGPPGRPGRVAVLPLARGRSHADVRQRSRRLDHGAAQVARRRAHRGQDGQPRRRERPEADRRAQLRAPQERPEVRRRDERPARGDLRSSAGRSSRASDLKEQAVGFVEDVVGATVAAYCPADVFPEEWDLEQLIVAMQEIFPTQATVDSLQGRDDLVTMQAEFVEEALAAYEAKEAAVTSEVMRELERVVLLNITDTMWREHLYEMDYLQEGIHLRALRAEGSDHRVPARGVRHVPGPHGVDPCRLRPIHLPRRVRAPRGPAGSSRPASRTTGKRSRGGRAACSRPTPAGRERRRRLATPRARAAAARSTRSATARPRELQRPGQELTGVLGAPDVELRDGQEPGGQVEGAGRRVLGSRILSVRERLDEQEPGPFVPQRLVETGHQARADPTTAPRHGHRHPGDLGHAGMPRSPRHEADGPLVEGHEPLLSAHGGGAIGDPLGVPEPVGKPGDDRVARGGVLDVIQCHDPHLGTIASGGRGRPLDSRRERDD